MRTGIAVKVNLGFSYSVVEAKLAEHFCLTFPLGFSILHAPCDPLGLGRALQGEGRARKPEAI